MMNHLSNRFTRAAALMTALVISSTALAPQLAAQAGGIAVGAVAPAMGALPTLDGKTFDLATIVGKKPVVMEFWATWCPLCKKLEPAMAKARADYGDKVSFVSVGVPDNQTPERQQQFVTERGLTGMFLFDRDHVAMKAFAVPHTSYVVVLDAAGKVVYTGVGGDQDVDAAIRRALPTR
jgi:thiol-disulfide isomerase/thioredoxin